MLDGLVSLSGWSLRARTAAAVASVALAVSGSASGALITSEPVAVGTGSATSRVQVDFTDGATAWFDVSFDPVGSVSAFDLLTVLDDEPGLGFFLHAKDFGGDLGQFVFGLGFGGHVDDDADEDFSPGSWTLWSRAMAEQPWSAAAVGVSSLGVADGSGVAFVFGPGFENGPPRGVPEPATAGLFAVGAAVFFGRRHRTAWAVVAVGAVAGSAAADPWADQVVSFVPGTNAAPGFTADPGVVLGEPTRTTSPGTAFGGQVTGFNPPFGADEVLSIGAGGELVVRFDEPVMDNVSGVNFGIDLLIFGNAFFTADSAGRAAGVASEPGRIAVSQTGEPGSWFEVPGVFADGRFPTEGFTDATGPFASDGQTPSDFTIPVDPAFDPVGLSYAEIVEGYAGSGGGVGVDFGATGLGWVQYVRVFQDAGDGWSTEVDGFADVVPEPGSALALAVAAAGGLVRRRRVGGVMRRSTGRTRAASDRRRGFSLIELLVAVSVIALLMSLVLPALGAAGEAGRRVVCQSNLRQMLTAAVMYRGDHDDRYPLAYWSEPGRLESWEITTLLGPEREHVPGVLWQGGGVLALQQDPSFDGPDNWSDAPFTGYNYNTSYLGKGQFESPQEPARGAAVHRPASAAVFGDGGFAGGANKFMRSPRGDRPGGDPAFSFGRTAGTQGYRHGGVTNVGWADGHVTAERQRFAVGVDQPVGGPPVGFLGSTDALYDLE